MKIVFKVRVLALLASYSVFLGLSYVYVSLNFCLLFFPVAAAAKSLQLCPTLCNPPTVRSHRWQPTRLLCPRILQARILEWVAISFSQFTARQALLSVFVWMTIESSGLACDSDSWLHHLVAVLC